MFRNKILSPLIISAILILFAIILNNKFKSEIKIVNLASKFQEEILIKQNQLKNDLKKIKSEIEKTEFQSGSGINEDRCDESGELILIYKYDSLIYWSDNYVPVPDVYDDSIFGKDFYHLGNGWFLIDRIEIENLKIIALQIVKHDYKYQNEYLKNTFQEDFSIPSDITIHLNEGSYNIYSASGKFLLSLGFPGKLTLDNKKVIILFVLYLLGFLFFISFLYHAHKSLTREFKNHGIFILTFLVDLVILRVLIVYFRIPHVIFESDLFSPVYYASSPILASLGHLLIDVLLLLTVSYVINTSLVLGKSIVRIKKSSKSVLIIMAFIAIFFLYKALIFLYSSIIINSSITLDLNRLLDLSVFSVVSYFIIASIIFSFFLLSAKLLDFINLLSNSAKKQRLIILCSIILIIALLIFTGKDQIFNAVILLTFIISYGIFVRKKDDFVRFTTVVFYLFLFAFLSTNILQQNIGIKEKEERKLLAVKLSAEQDPIAEYLFNDIERRMYIDEQLKNYIIDAAFDETLESKAIEYLKKNYFNDYWSKYDLLVTICSDEKLLDIEFEDVIMDCNDYFEKKIFDIGKKTGNPDLFYMDYGFGNDSYLAILSFQRSKDTIVKTYIETVSKVVPKGLGYPELLIDKDVNVKNETSEYSYAIYKRNELFKLVGKYSYGTNDDEYDTDTSAYRFFNENSYNHLFYKPYPGTSIIISKANRKFLDVIAPFSYLFIFQGLYILFFLIVIHFPYRRNILKLNFRNQLQLSIVSIVIVSFLLIGIASLTYIVNLNNNKNYDILREKAHSVLIELEHKLSAEDKLTPELHEYLSVLLIKFSNVFFSDINLYDTDGKLLASSRPQIFEEGLISDRMNTNAYFAMSVEKMSNFIQRERICSYEYLSVYKPFWNAQNKLIAYVNLPYFAKQGELRDEISTFLVTFINIYVILIAISVFIALLVSNYISRPLKLIKDKLSNLQFGQLNEKINWMREDEIGNLISEYNRMIDELAESADLLAKSERESAWREMAKQVAHEIKNPLTPMKLNVQHLRKAWEEKAEDWNERLIKFSDTLIEQIESLSAIASEFSDFANMPKAKSEKVELGEVIKNSIQLHNNYDNINFEYHSEENTHHYILADKKQILRVFNNLIKNSIQAIGNKSDGQVIISIESLDETYIIKVTDNGSGISKEQGDKIFVPSFTTKSSGMGLGLSMVRSIIISSGGNIHYTSEQGQGTTFILHFPKYID